MKSTTYLVILLHSIVIQCRVITSPVHQQSVTPRPRLPRSASITDPLTHARDPGTFLIQWSADRGRDWLNQFLHEDFDTKIEDMTKDEKKSHQATVHIAKFTPQPMPKELKENLENEKKSPNSTESARADREVLPAGVVVGYNCSIPLNLRAVAPPLSGDPCDSQRRITGKKEGVVAQIIQREKYHRFKGHKLEVRETLYTYECGATDHASPFRQTDHYDWPLILNETQAKETVRTRTFKTKKGEVNQELKMNSYTALTYTSVGSVFMGTYWPHWEPNEVHCGGGSLTFTIDGVEQTHKEMVRFNLLKIQLKEEELIRDTETNEVVTETGVKLSCSARTGFCSTSEASYVWEPPSPDYCPYALARVSEGIVVTDDADDEVFMSTDDSLIRLMLKQPAPACGRMLRRTNQPGVFINLDMDAPITRKLAGEELRYSTYITTRDDYIYNYVLDQVEKELNVLLQEDCATSGPRGRGRFFLQHTLPGYSNFFMDNGTFATAAGEVLYYYECERQYYEPQLTHLCYDAIPVIPYEKNVLKPLVTPISDRPTLFLEPLTRRLLTSAAEVPCTETFASLFQTAHGGWMAVVNQTLVEVEAPLRTPVHAPRTIHFDRMTNTATGGLYNIEELQRMEDYRNLPRAQTVMTYQLTQQAEVEAGQYITPTKMFPDTSATGWFSGILHHLLWILETYGNFCAVVFSLVLIFSWLRQLFMCTYGATKLKRRHGCSRYLMYACCPSLFLFSWYNQAKKEEKEPKYAAAAAVDEDVDVEAARRLHPDQADDDDEPAALPLPLRELPPAPAPPGEIITTSIHSPHGLAPLSPPPSPRVDSLFQGQSIHQPSAPTGGTVQDSVVVIPESDDRDAEEARHCVNYLREATQSMQRLRRNASVEARKIIRPVLSPIQEGPDVTKTEEK